MWIQIGKIVVLICIISILVAVGGFIGMVAGLVIGIIYLPVKILSMLRENCEPRIINDDEI